MFRKPQNLKDLTLHLILGLFNLNNVPGYRFFAEQILMNSSYILWNTVQDYQLGFILTNHLLVTAFKTQHL